MLQSYNPQNENIFIHIGGDLYPRAEARISVFDSSVQGGDAVWEGLRVYNGKIFAFNEHIIRLQESAHALMFAGIPDADNIKQAVFSTLLANKMFDKVHIRLTLTRGEKITSGMDPRLNQKGCTLIVLAEWKAPVYGDAAIKLITASTRRHSALSLDSKIHHNNLLNNILAKIEANLAGADDALMLDLQGFIAETNATNVFMVKNGKLFTPSADSCVQGITRSFVIMLARNLGIECIEKNISLTEIYNADEVFVSGTMGELTPVSAIDGRIISSHHPTHITAALCTAYMQKVSVEGEPIPHFPEGV